LAAGAIVASTSKPRQPPRGKTVIVTMPTQPVYVNDPTGKMLQLTVVAPAWCNPCSNEPMQIAVNGASYYVTTPPAIYAGQSFVAIVPAQQAVYPPAQPTVVVVNPPKPRVIVVPDIVVDPVFVSEVNSIRTMQVTVPMSYGPFMNLKVRMPEGDIRSMQIPAGVHHPNSFTFTYNPTAEAEARRQRALAEAEAQRQKAQAEAAERIQRELNNDLDRNYRCCCQEADGQCLWYPNRLLKPGKHCPRLQLEGQKRCTKNSCPLLGGKGCTMTHHGKGKCMYSKQEQYVFQGHKC